MVVTKKKLVNTQIIPFLSNRGGASLNNSIKRLVDHQEQ